MPKSSSHIQHLIFDFGAVLLPVEEERTWEAFRELGARERLADQKDIFKKLETGAFSKEAFLEALQPHFFRPHIFKPDLAEAWAAMCYHPISDEVISYLQKLRRKGFQLFLLSNTNEIHVQKVKERSGPFRYRQFINQFSGVYYSQEIGLRKPQKAIYERVLQESNLNPAECWYTDDRKENLKAPQNLGITTWHYHSERSFADLQRAIRRLY